MKPHSLQFTNIRSYASFGPVSFEDRSLVGILGDTGAGKSTILEALCLALYGQASWQGGRIEDLMADGAPHMTVDLTFAHAGQKWRVHRTYYANTRPTLTSLRNLDTGAAVDGARAVNAAVSSLLRMDFDAFRSAVLLPQGRFQTLLHASKTERAPLLKGIFGADLIEQVNNLAATRAEELSVLLNAARLARAALPADPAGQADASDKTAATQSALAATLAGHANAVRDLIATARHDAAHHVIVRETRARIVAAADALATAGVEETIIAASVASAALADRQHDLTHRAKSARTSEDAASDALKSAVDRGEGRAHIDAARALLASIPRRAAVLSGHDAELGAEQERLKAEEARVAAMRTALSLGREKVEAANETAGIAEAQAERAAIAASTLRDTVSDLLETAREIRGSLDQAGRHRRDSACLVGLLETAIEDLAPAREGKETAEKHLTDLRRSASASAAGVGLHSGDDCPVCARVLPPGWQAPDNASTNALAMAQRAVVAADDAFNQASIKVGTLQEQHGVATRQADEAARRAAELQVALDRELDDFGSTKGISALSAGIDLAALIAAVRVAVTDSADPVATPTPARTALDSACAPAAQYATQVHSDASSARKAATNASNQLSADLRETDTADAVLARDTNALQSNLKRRRATFAELASELAGLPAPIASALPHLKDTPVPDWMLDTSAGPLAAASAVAESASAALAAYEQDRDSARDELAEIATAQETLRSEHATQVDAPLRTAVRLLDRAAHVLEDSDREAPQATGEQTDPDAVNSYAAAVRDVLAEADSELAQQVSSVAETASRSLSVAAEAWRDALSAAGENIDAADAAVLEPDPLTPVTVAAGMAHSSATRALSDAEVARAAIGRAAALDSAIAAGQARADALVGLRAALARSKFPAHLVARRTAALLALASDLFGRLSGGEFGFSEDFQVVARRTGSVRDPKTLSGGETFLASLALALSLVELYSRAGGRLGALFLDEGFGSLDTDTLAAALEALTAETGGEKLVAVISHLHAVAEAVNNVLWVAKDLGSSHAAWLTAEQMEDLVRADAAGGLLALA